MNTVLHANFAPGVLVRGAWSLITLCTVHIGGKSELQVWSLSACLHEGQLVDVFFLSFKAFSSMNFNANSLENGTQEIGSYILLAKMLLVWFRVSMGFEPSPCGL